MKLKALLLVLVLAFAPDFADAYGYVQKLGLVSATNTLTATPSASGNLWIISVWTSGGGGSPYATAITDTQSNTWHSVFGSFGATSDYFTVTGGFFARQYWAAMSATTSNTVTITFHGGNPGTIFIFGGEYSGLINQAPLTFIHNEQASPGTGTNGVTTSGGTGSGTISAAPAMILGMAWNDSININWNGGTGFTQRWNTGGPDFWSLEDQNQATTGTYNATFTLGTNEDTVSVMTAWQETSASGPPPSQFFLWNPKLSASKVGLQ